MKTLFLSCPLQRRNPVYANLDEVLRNQQVKDISKV